MRAILLALLIALPLPAVALELSAWQATQQREHPLAGKVADASGKEASLTALAEAAAAADHVLIGEIHDNADHHALQAAIVRAMAQAGRRPALVFEMIPRGMQGEVDAFLALPSPDAAEFGVVVKWEERGWPAWAANRPILDVALEYRLPVVAGDLDRETIRAIGRQGPAALPAEEATRYGLDRPLEAAQEAAMLDDVDKGHCGLMPKQALGPMVNVQRARDGSLADAMIAARASGADGAVLIAGSGHTRADRGAPSILALREPQARIVAIALAEARAGADDLAAYADAHAFTLVTPAAEREDQCEALRKQMGKN